LFHVSVGDDLPQCVTHSSCFLAELFSVREPARCAASSRGRFQNCSARV
jgi:hypothetical protein